ncbi:MAG: CHAT domain-containing protein [Acidobacteriota bacterium]
MKLRLCPLPALMSVLACAAVGCGPPDPPTFGEPLLRAHEDFHIDHGGPVPLYLGEGSRFGLCVPVPTSVDTSQWRARLTIRSDASKPRELEVDLSARTGKVACFDGNLPDGLPAEASLEFCATLVDTFDDSRWTVSCLPARFRSDIDAFLSSFESQDRVLAKAPDIPTAELVAALDEVAELARQAGLPARAVRTELVVVYFLRRGDDGQRAEARQRLDSMPRWLDQPAAAALAAEVALESATLRLAEASPEARRRAMLDLRTAEEGLQISAHPLRLSATVLHANMLAQLGLAGAAAASLRLALDGCRDAPCHDASLRMARGTLPWLTALDPLARPEELEAGRRDLEELLDYAGDRPEASGPTHPEAANEWLNLAVIQLRLGADPRGALGLAARHLPQSFERGGRDEVLSGWRLQLLGATSLAAGDVEAALERCRQIPLWLEPQLAAAAWSCRAQAHKRLGRPGDATAAFERALEEHSLAASRPSDIGFALGPGPHAEDVARLARHRIDEGEVAAAWALLEGLDATHLSQATRRRCRQQASSEEARNRWRELDESRAGILHALKALEGPSSGRRGREVESGRRVLWRRWQDLSRERPGCPGLAPTPPPTPFGHRVFALDDEVITLRAMETADGTSFSLVKRTPLPRQRLLSILDAVEDATASGAAEDAAWRELLAPLADALVPRGPLGPTTYFRLHGILQAAPLAALPISERADGARWLLDLTLPVLVPSSASPSDTRPHAGPPAFLIDPTGDLPNASRLSPFYRESFPSARIFDRSAATSAVFQDIAGDASFVHFDAHGRFEEALPELSAILLADGALTWPEVARRAAPWAFANLSGCRTGVGRRGPNSGRYGLAGLLIERGVGWVLASRSLVHDPFASDFNRSFYRAIQRGDAPDGAYAAALRGLSRRYPAAVWASTFLITAEAPAQKKIRREIEGGNSERRRIPHKRMPDASREDRR